MPFDPFCRTSRTTFPSLSAAVSSDFRVPNCRFSRAAGISRPCSLPFISKLLRKGCHEAFYHSAFQFMYCATHRQFTHRPGRPIKSFCPLIPEDRPLPDCSAAIVFRDYLLSLIDWCRREDIDAPRTPRSLRI